MGSIRKHWGRKLLVVMIAATAILLIALYHTPTSNALVGGPNVCAYYSNATYTTVVGARGTGCCGAVINWGITTPYKKCQTIYCTQNICNN